MPHLPLVTRRIGATTDAARSYQEPRLLGMGEYAVVWTDSENESELWVGSLNLDPDRVLLEGGNGYRETAHELPLATIARARRAGALERIDGYPSLRLELRPGRTFTIASLISVGTVSELLASLAELLPYTP